MLKQIALFQKEAKELGRDENSVEEIKLWLLANLESDLEFKKAAEWEELPRGWSRASLESFWKSIGGSVTECAKKMEGKVTDAGAFCASLKDKIERTTKWRGK